MSYDTPPGPRLDGARQLGLDLVGVAERDELAAPAIRRAGRPAAVDQADDPAQLMTELAEARAATSTMSDQVFIWTVIGTGFGVVVVVLTVLLTVIVRQERAFDQVCARPSPRGDKPTERPPRASISRRRSTVHHTTLMIIGGVLLAVGILIVAIGNIW